MVSIRSERVDTNCTIIKCGDIDLNQFDALYYSTEAFHLVFISSDLLSVLGVFDVELIGRIDIALRLRR